MKPSGKPDAGNLPVRFDEGGGIQRGPTSTLRSEEHCIFPFHG